MASKKQNGGVGKNVQKKMAAACTTASKIIGGVLSSVACRMASKNKENGGACGVVKLKMASSHVWILGSWDGIALGGMGLNVEGVFRKLTV
jgi:hypothetical protein